MADYKIPTSKLKEQALEKAGKLTVKGRRSLDKEDFALAPRKEEKGRGLKGRFPIPDAAHARNALARAAQKKSKLSPEQMAQVRAKVHSKFPGVGSSKLHSMKMAIASRVTKNK